MGLTTERAPNTELINRLQESAQQNNLNRSLDKIPEGFSMGSQSKFVLLNPVNWGYIPEKDETSEYLLLKEVVVPLEHEGIRFAVQTITYEVPVKEDDEKKPELGIFVFGGGSSDAYTGIAFLKRISNAIQNQKEFGYRVKVTILPSITATTRSSDFNNSEATIYETAAPLYKKLLEAPEMNTPENVGLVGYSNGAIYALELGGQITDKTRFISLIDPVGMAENPNLEFDIFKDGVIKAYQKFRTEGHSFLRAAEMAFTEFRLGMPGTWGVSSGLLDMVYKMIYSDQDLNMARVGEQFGLRKTVKTVLNVSDMKKDITQKARRDVSVPVILSMNIGSEVANPLWELVKENIKSKYPKFTVEDFMMAIMEQGDNEIKALAEKALQTLFSKNRHLVKMNPFHSSIHGIAFLKNQGQEFWNHIFAKTTEVLS